MHHPKYLMQKGESLEEYSQKIIIFVIEKNFKDWTRECGWVCRRDNNGWFSWRCSSAPNYWKYIRKICDKYNIHLLLDEIYCGTGTSGKCIVVITMMSLQIFFS